MKELIDVFKMDVLPGNIRARVIIKLGRAIDNEHGMSLTGPIVFELVSILDPQNELLKDEDFIKRANK